MEGCCHHSGQPGLVHAVYHPVSLINYLTGDRKQGSTEDSLLRSPQLRSPGVQKVAYQEAKLLEAESWGLVNVVHQAARCGHQNVSQAMVTIYSTNQKDSKKGNVSQGHLTVNPHTQSTAATTPAKGHRWAGEGPPEEPTTWHTYVFWTRLSCSLASDFCPVTKATLRGVASV